MTRRTGTVWKYEGYGLFVCRSALSPIRAGQPEIIHACHGPLKRLQVKNRSRASLGIRIL